MSATRGWSGIVVGLALALAACQAPAAQTPAAQPAARAPAAPQAAPRAEAPAPANADLQKVIDAARQEGQLALSWSQTYDAAPFIDGFNRTYGLNLNVRFTPVSNFRSAIFQIVQEVQSGRTPTADLVMASPNLLLRMVQTDTVEPVDWSWAPNLQNPELIAPNNAAVVVFHQMEGITYNTGLLTGSQVPRTLQDLLKPELKGRLASTPQAIGFGDLGSPDMWGEERLFDYLASFSTQLAGLIQCGDDTRVASGEFAAFAIDCGQGATLRAKAQGQPLDYVVPADAAKVWPGYLVLPRGAAHPNAAKLWVNYMLTREAQDRFYDLTYADTHLVPGAKSSRLLDDLKASGAKIHTVDLPWVAAQGDNTARQDKASELLRAGGSR
jgi:ABC-type Fe3+ transport system substrate-binding protein